MLFGKNNVCKIHNLFRSHGEGWEAMGKSDWPMQGLVVWLRLANPSGKLCLWTMHSSQAQTMLDFSMCRANAVWIKVNFCKINDLLRARGAYWFVYTIDLYKNLLMCTHQVHPTCSHDCAKARWPPQHAYITTHHTTTHTTTTPHIQNSNQNGAMPVAKVVWHNDLSAGSKNNTEANQASLWLAWAMP